MDDITKRMHYFDQQFLVEADFTDEQKYHLDRRYRHNRLLHTPGVAEGLSVVKSGDKQVTVKVGTAIDKLGRELVLAVDEPVLLTDAAKFKANTQVFVAIGYRELASDFPPSGPLPPDNPTNNRRWTEKPQLVADTTQPPAESSAILLARFTLDGSGNVPAAIINNSVKAGAIGVVAASLKGISNPGGNIDLVQSNAIVIGADDATNQITIGENHSSVTGNAHNLTASNLQTIGALLASQYDLRQRKEATIKFVLDATTTPVTTVQDLNFGFLPKFALGYGVVNATLGPNKYGGLTTGYFDATAGQHGFGIVITKLPGTGPEWIMESRESGDIFTCQVFDRSGTPLRGETLTVTVKESVGTKLTVQLNRTTVSGFSPLTNFSITLVVLGMGS
ncbi:MAG TPA: hypothetical protein VJ302_00595 [Blastocatellia bacterium]|nr:hypothetical protein [Blastocatellia bacterium]